MNIQIAKISVPVDIDAPSSHTLLSAIAGLEADNERLCFALFHCGQDIAEIVSLTTTGNALSSKKATAIFKLALAAERHAQHKEP